MLALPPVFYFYLINNCFYMHFNLTNVVTNILANNKFLFL